MQWYAVTAVNQETQAWMYAYDFPLLKGAG